MSVGVRRNDDDIGAATMATRARLITGSLLGLVCFLFVPLVSVADLVVSVSVSELNTEATSV